MQIEDCAVLKKLEQFKARTTRNFVAPKGRFIEAKRSTSEAQMERDCDTALTQIEARQYADSLYGCRTILRCGVAFYRKSAPVKKG